jgi:hypothetical protein
VARFHKINRNGAAVGIQNVGLDVDHSVKRLRVTNLPGVFTVAGKMCNVLKPFKGRCQRLTLRRKDPSVVVTSTRQQGLYVGFPIAVIARVYIEIGICTREPDEYIALWRAADPQRQPEI